ACDLLLASGAAYALDQHGEASLFASTPRSDRAVARPPRTVGARVALAARVILGAAALLLLVVRPVAAAWAAQQGIQLTPTDPARAVERLTRAVELDPANELYWVKLGAAAQ